MHAKHLIEQVRNGIDPSDALSDALVESSQLVSKAKKILGSSVGVSQGDDDALVWIEFERKDSKGKPAGADLVGLVKTSKGYGFVDEYDDPATWLKNNYKTPEIAFKALAKKV